MLRQLWERVARLWRTTPCVGCGAPSVGFAAQVAGKIKTKGAAGEPQTNYYLGNPRAMCAACLEAERRNTPRRAEEE